MLLKHALKSDALGGCLVRLMNALARPIPNLPRFWQCIRLTTGFHVTLAV